MMSSTNPKFIKSSVIHSYAKYVLEKGSDFEKTRLVRNLDTKLAIHNRTLINA